jgi:hypothetical protein
MRTRREFLRDVCSAAVTAAACTAAQGCRRAAFDATEGSRARAALLEGAEAAFRPTATGCTVHWVPAMPLDARLLAGATADTLDVVQEITSDGPTEAVLAGHAPDSEVYWRCDFRPRGSQAWIPSPVRRFRTQRPAGGRFDVALVADTHVAHVLRSPQRVKNVASLTDHLLADRPEFVVFMGDEATTYTPDEQGGQMNDETKVRGRWRAWRELYAPLLASVPSYLVLGNHEGEGSCHQAWTRERWAMQRWSTIARKRYLLNPLPTTYPEGGENAGWSGDQNDPNTGGAQAGNCSPFQNYYAWTWGDALFVVLDVQRYMSARGDAPTVPEQRSLGTAQLSWLERTLARSTARWKFVLGHNVVGGWRYNRAGSAPGAYGRGGARYAYVGQQAQVTELMKRYGARLFLYGHDHIFAHQQTDGIQFVCCGRPTKLPARDESTPGWVEAYGHAAARNPHDFYMALGYTRLSISPERVVVRYIRTGTDQFQRENVHTPEGETVYEFTLT